MVILTRGTVGTTIEEDKGPVLDWRRADWDGMREELRDTGWMQGLRDGSTEESWDIFRKSDQNGREVCAS